MLDNLYLSHNIYFGLLQSIRNMQLGKLKIMKACPNLGVIYTNHKLYGDVNLKNLYFYLEIIDRMTFHKEWYDTVLDVLLDIANLRQFSNKQSFNIFVSSFLFVL